MVKFQLFHVAKFSRYTTFVLEKNVFTYLCFNKPKKLRSRHENSIYFSNCNKHYACNFTKSLLLLTIPYHYFHHLKVRKCCQRHPPIQVRYLLHISQSNIVITFIQLSFSTRGSVSYNRSKDGKPLIPSTMAL